MHTEKRAFTTFKRLLNTAPQVVMNNFLFMQYYQTRLACVHYKLQCLNAEYAFHTETLPSLNMLSSLVVTIPVSEL